MTDYDVDGFLMGGGAPSAKFHAIGTKVGGVICRPPYIEQQRDYITKELKAYRDSGKPMMQMVVPIQTDQRDPAIEHDDGIRAFYLKGQAKEATATAVRAAGAARLEIGGYLALTWVSEKPVPHGNPQKIYVGEYTPPGVDVAPAAPPAMYPTTTTVTTGAGWAAPGGPPPGIDASTWATLTPEARQRATAAIQAAMGGTEPPF